MMKGKEKMTVNIKEEVKAIENKKSFRERTLMVNARIKQLCLMLDEARYIVEEIPEENSSEALKHAYKELGRAFTDTIAVEQAKLTEEVMK